MSGGEDLAFLGEEFLTWLWFRIERDGGEFEIAPRRTVAVSMDDFLSFAPRADDETEQTLRKGLPTRSAEGRAALRNGRRLRRARLVVAEGAQQFALVLDGPNLHLSGVRLPDDPEDVDENERGRARIDAFKTIVGIVHGLYALFLRDRLRGDYLQTAGAEQATWMAQ